MGGAGRKDFVGTAITARKAYRTVAAADTDVDEIEEIIDTRFDDNGMPATQGTDSVLALYVLLGDGVTAATLQLYANGTDESAAGDSSSSSGDPASEWCFYAEFTVDTKNLLRWFPVLPASEFKVMVTSITGSGEVVIREAHAA